MHRNYISFTSYSQILQLILKLYKQRLIINNIKHRYFNNKCETFKFFYFHLF